MIKPTVGRIVHYWPATGQKESQPYAAIIVCVWSDTCVNLAVFNRSGGFMQNVPTSILLIQEGNEVPSGGNYCEWPLRV